MREMLLEGKKIRLGDLGDFSLLLTSKGAEDADKFTAQNITGVKVQWEPGQEFKNLRDDAEYRPDRRRGSKSLRVIFIFKPQRFRSFPVTVISGH